MPKRILVVDDESDTLALMLDVLASEGYEVRGCHSAAEAIDALWNQRFDLVLTDIRMPKMSGVDLLAQVDCIAPGTRVILVTAYASIQTAVAAVRGHAFDYLVKPFAPGELRRQVARALLPRAPREPQQAVRRHGELTIDQGARRVWVQGREVRLTRSEFDALALLAERNGGAVSYQEIDEKVRGRVSRAETPTYGAKSCIHRLRKKLGESAESPRLILNVRGIGYRFGG